MSSAVSVPEGGIIVLVDRETAALVARIVARTIRTSRTPAAFPELDELVEQLISAARSGQDGPTFGALVDDAALVLDDGAMLLNQADVAAVLRVSLRTARRRIEAGDLPSVKLGGRRLVRRDDLVRFVAGLHPAATAQVPRGRAGSLPDRDPVEVPQ